MLSRPMESGLLRALEVITVVLPTIFFAAATLAHSLRPSASPILVRPNLWKAQIILTACIILATTVEAIVVVRRSDPYSTNDPEVVYHLFLTFVWTVLLLGLVDCRGSTRYPHYGAWALMLTFSGSVTALRHAEAERSDSSLRIVAEGCRLAFNASLLGIGLLHHLPCQRSSDCTADESQPLLSDTDTSTTKAPKEADAKKEQEEIDREKIRNRPFWQYVGSFKIFLPYMYPCSRRQQLYVVGMCTCTALGRVVAFAVPLSVGKVVDSLDGDVLPWRPILLYTALRLVNSQAGLLLLDHWFYTRVNTEMTTNLNRHSYNHIMKLSADFHDSQRTSITWSSMQYGQEVIGLFHNTVFGILPTLLDLVAAASVLTFLFGPYMLFTITFTIVLFYWLMCQTLMQKTALRRVWIDAYHDEYYQMTESSTNWTTVTHFGQIQHEIGRYREKSGTAQVALMIFWFCDCTARALRQLVPALSFLAACGIAGLQIIHKQHKIGDFVVLITYWAQLTGPLGSLAHEFSSIGQKLVQAEKLLVLLEKNPKTSDEEDAPAFKFVEGAVEFDRVSFSYDGTRKVTNGLTFRATPGTTIALVGVSGAGKSTILKLLYRFYDTEQGRILIDGQDIRKVQMESFRKHIATVPQSPAVFNMTVMENIKYPDLNSSDEEAIEASKAAALHDKIMAFTNGYSEKVGERGTKLSGGELQRLAIARAMMKKADILLLDEATSNVDSITEAQIQDALRKLCVSKTAFVIAHRLSTILQADQILVVHEGMIAEAGTHQELIKNKGPYYKLWSSQLKLQAQKPGSKLESDSLGKDMSELLPTEEVPPVCENAASSGSGSTIGDQDEELDSENSSLSSTSEGS